MKYTVEEIIEYVEASIDHDDFADDEAWFSRTMREEILKALKKCQWIPVSERLPKEYEDVLVSLVCTENGGYTGVAMDCIAYDGKWFAHYNDSVVAWMPLPEPYKESDNDAKD